jgi:hypothetical protein
MDSQLLSVGHSQFLLHSYAILRHFAMTVMSHPRHSILFIMGSMLNSIRQLYATNLGNWYGACVGGPKTHKKLHF